MIRRFTRDVASGSLTPIADLLVDSDGEPSLAYLGTGVAKYTSDILQFVSNLNDSLFTNDLKSFFKKDLNNTGVLIKQANVKLHGLTIINQNTYDVWLKFYNKATAPTVGTDETINKFQVPANGSLILDTTAQVKNICTLGLGVAVTKLYLDSDTTAVATNCELFLSYKFS